jgi:UDP-N-acetylmuramoylalanine--D-glutamate ligase
VNLVAGLGITGQSVLRYLDRLNEPMIGFDTRADFDLAPLQKDYPKLNFFVGHLPSSVAKKISRVILSPGIDQREPWVQALKDQGAEIIGDIELFARATRQPIIAITGSNGKSTVTTLVGELLKAAGYQVGVGGNLGIPALNFLMHDVDYDVFVLELSSFQLETVYSLHTAASVVLNICEDHLDRYADMQAYIQAKLTIYQDTELALIPKGYEAQFHVPKTTVKTYFDVSEPMNEHQYGVITQNQQAWLAKGNQMLMPVNRLALSAPHHILNALAAIALCQDFDVSLEHIQRVLGHFKGLPHRTQLVGEWRGIKWVDDSKGTNVGATLSALESLGQSIAATGKVILLAGGVGKEADFSPLISALNRYARAVVLFGRDADRIESDVANGLSENAVCVKVTDLQTAIREAKSLAQAGDMVLLSPACDRFDQFKNYVDRGEKFAKWVNELEGQLGE